MMSVIFVALFFSVHAAQQEIIILPDDDYNQGYTSTPYVSQCCDSTGQLAPGEEAIFYFTIPANGPNPIWKHATLNLFGHNFASADENFNVRLRKGNANFDDRDSELKKKTWGDYAARNLYVCDVEKSKTYYIQVENPASNIYNSSLDISVDIDNDDTCKTVAEFGEGIGKFFAIVLLSICAIVAAVVILIVVCCLGCHYSKRNTNALRAPGPHQPGPHPYYNPPVNPQVQPPPQQQQHQQAVAVRDPEQQIAPSTYGIPASQNSNSEAMDKPLISAGPRLL